MANEGWALGGRIALVTGAGTRLGRAIAEGLGAVGVDVAVHCHGSTAGAGEAAAAIRVHGSRAEVFQADLADAAAIPALVDDVERRLGPISILVSSAALFEAGTALEGTVASLDRQWAVNARAPFLLAQVVGGRMRGRGQGDLIHLLDVGGTTHVWRDHVAYSMTKAALHALTRALAAELAPAVRVNAVAPGPVLPPASFSEAQLDGLRRSVPQGRLGSPADVVRAVRFLLEGPAFITGHVLTVDGGQSLPLL